MNENKQKIINKVFSYCNKTGKKTIGFFELVGEIFLFALKGLYSVLTPPIYKQTFIKQMLDICFYSLPVVGMTTLFAGMVLALQGSAGVDSQFAETIVPNFVALGITRELAPVLTGLMIAGRIGASFAAELGTMRVTEQIDALTTLSTSPMKYLITPRIYAAIISLPILVFIGDIIGLLGGYIIGVIKLGYNQATYMQNTIDALSLIGVMSGLTKAVAFGFIVAVIGCYQGFNSKGGAQGVGKATTNAVVISSILVLISNYLITEMFVGV